MGCRISKTRIFNRRISLKRISGPQRLTVVLKKLNFKYGSLRLNECHLCVLSRYNFNIESKVTQLIIFTSLLVARLHKILNILNFI